MRLPFERVFITVHVHGQRPMSCLFAVPASRVCSLRCTVSHCGSRDQTRLGEWRSREASVAHQSWGSRGATAWPLPPRQAAARHVVCYLRQGSRVFETYWTTIRGVEAMDNNYRLLDLTVYGRQEPWEDSPPGWPQRFEGKQNFGIDGRPIPQWSRLKAGHSDDLGVGTR